MEAKPFLEIHAELGESMLYDHERDLLFWIDVTGQKLHITTPATKETKTLDLADNLGVLALVEGDDKHILAAAKRGPALIDLETGKIEYLARYYPDAESDG
jgi:sugar lactone lactonase YvrE